MRLLPLFSAAVLLVVLGGALTAPLAQAAERINHEGRVLGAEPVVRRALLFNTVEADAVVSALQIMPVTSAWNEDISRRPLLANSAAMMAQIAADLSSSRQTLRPFFEMNYVLVPDDQPLRAINFFNYPDESDLNGGNPPSGLYPFPANTPVEGWPAETGSLSLAEWQRDVEDTGGDRHAIVVQPRAGRIFETWLTKFVGSGIEASNGAIFSLKSNAPRPAGWTSADAAGLPMFPAVVRYDECQRGKVEHALRLIVKRTRVGPIYPATHSASVGNTTDPNIPAMGQRLRLKAGFAVPAGWTREAKAVVYALKKYGAIVADNGNFFSVSVAPDDRFREGAFAQLSTIGIDQFEVVQTTGRLEGPRSPGAPVVRTTVAVANAKVGKPLALAGQIVRGKGAITWSKAQGPGAVQLSRPGQLATTATFAKAGSYVVLLSLDDGVHAVARAGVRVTVSR